MQIAGYSEVRINPPADPIEVARLTKLWRECERQSAMRELEREAAQLRRSGRDPFVWHVGETG